MKTLTMANGGRPQKPLPSARKTTSEQLVGIGNLPTQLRRKCLSKGFHFTLMVVGETGLGKSTLINSLFLTDLYVSAVYGYPSPTVEETLTINESTFQVSEGNVNLNLTVIDTPGFGDNVDNTGSWDAILSTVDEKLQDYLNAESRVMRKIVPDTRVHCCLYFIAPNGCGLKPLDVEFMLKLHKKVNIIPIIAKADTLTHEECVAFKKQILREISDNSIDVYTFPPLKGKASTPEVDYVSRIPFAVVGSTILIEKNGKVIRGREYPWGIVDADNLEHCDFVALRSVLVCSHMQDLIEVTNDVHYEHFRSSTLAKATGDDVTSPKPVAHNFSPLDKMEREREERERRLKAMEIEMEQVFAVKVEEKKKKLENTEREFQKKYEITMEQLSKLRKETEERRLHFEKEQKEWTTRIGGDGKKEKKKSKHK